MPLKGKPLDKGYCVYNLNLLLYFFHSALSLPWSISTKRVLQKKVTWCMRTFIS